MSILIVEDEAAIRSLFVEVLSERYQCHAVETAEEGLQLLTRERCALIITDVNLPGIGGQEFAERAKLMQPDVKLLVISGAPLAAGDGWSLLDVFAYLQKPLNFAELEATVAKALQTD
ncbi:MAG: response regulator [Pyrinomonadaceae bacterium]